MKVPDGYGRLRLDIRDMPIQMLAALKLRAFSEDQSLTRVCREALIESAKRLEPQEPDWEPLR
jgi:hypothetical protein